ncbi:M48 family metalloprotease [Magnetococcales bacterium HHB-1]
MSISRFRLFWILLLSLLLPFSTEAKNLKLIYDAETLDFLKKLGRPLIEAAGRSPERVRFHVIQHNALNAFALANENIVFHSGLLLAADTPAELAGVMAHEIAHVAAGHHAKLKTDLRNQSIKSLIIAAIGIAAQKLTGASDLANAGIFGGRALAQSSLLAAIRQKESQADRLALRYMNKAQYHPAGLSHFFEKIAQRQRLANRPAPYLLTHPTSSRRLSLMRDMIPAGRAPPKASIRLAKIQIKITLGLSFRPKAKMDHLLKTFAHSKRFSLQEKKTIQNYIYAIGNFYQGDLSLAEKYFSLLIKERSQDDYLYRDRGRTYLQAGKLKKAEKDLKRALKAQPENIDFNFQYAKLLTEQGKLKKASRLLRRLTLQEKERGDFLHLLGRVEGQRGALAASHLALARFHRLNKDLELTHWHYKKAIQLAKAHSPEKRLAKAEWKTFKETLKKNLLHF